jgi:hypothetical protein
LKSLFLTHWINPDLRNDRTYVSSYKLRSDDEELYSIDLNKQLGFYQICEFVPANGTDNFIIEQTNRVGTPKISAFEKDSAKMLGTFKGNQFVDSDENLIFSIESVANLKNRDRATSTFCTDSDFVALAADQKRVIALLCRRPRRPAGFHPLLRFKDSFFNLTKTEPRDVFEIIIKDEQCCDQRMLAAIAVIVHDRGGLYVRNKNAH